MRHSVRGLAVLALTLGGVMLATAPARASCLPPNLADQIARADVIADGRVTSVDRGAGTLSFVALTVYKGDPGSGSLTVRVGPGGGAATSVDYRAEPGEHVLYLQRNGSAYATNDCSGSHPGPATTEELGLLQAGKVITHGDPGPDPVERVGGAAAAIAGLGALLVIAVIALVVLRRTSSASGHLR